jgi:hypothetical protein
MENPGASPGTATATLPMDSYSWYYHETNWLAQRFRSDNILQEFSVLKEGQYKTGPQLLDDICKTWDEMPHAYLTMVKDK